LRYRLLALGLLTFLLIIKAPQSLGGEGTKILWIYYTAPFAGTSPYYALLREILTSEFNAAIEYRTSWDINYLYSIDVRLGDWLQANGYDLIVVSWSHKAHLKGVKKLLEEALKVNIPILLVPGARWDLTLDLGLGMRDTLLFNFSVGVAEHEATQGVYVVGVREYGVIALFVPVGVEAYHWRPLAVARGGALAVVGEFNDARIAAIAPYLYADDSYDNRRLLEAVTAWLLRVEPPPREGEWPPINASEYKVKLLAEIEELKARKSTLQEEIANLTAKLSALNKTLNTISDLKEKLHKLSEQLEEARNETNMLLQRINSLEHDLNNAREESRNAYRMLGIATAIGIICGVALDRITIRFFRKTQQ